MDRRSLVLIETKRPTGEWDGFTATVATPSIKVRISRVDAALQLWVSAARGIISQPCARNAISRGEEDSLRSPRWSFDLAILKVDQQCVG